LSDNPALAEEIEQKVRANAGLIADALMSGPDDELSTGTDD